DDGAPVARVTAGGDEGAAMVAGAGAGRRAGRLFGDPLIVVGQLEPGVERHDVPEIELAAARLLAVDDALDLLAILLLDARPQDLLGGLAEEGPILLLLMGHLRRDRFEVVG